MATRARDDNRETAALVVETPLRWVWAAAQDGRLVGCGLVRTRPEARAAVEEAGGRDGVLEALAADLRRYFAGERVDFRRYEVEISDQPAFRRRALLAAREIPYGEVRTYGWLAARAGSPRGARAAGQAMAHNPIGLVIPCHRVIAAGGKLGGFGGGLGLKRALLELEGVRFRGRRVADES